MLSSSGKAVVYRQIRGYQGHEREVVKMKYLGVTRIRVNICDGKMIKFFLKVNMDI